MFLAKLLLILFIVSLYKSRSFNATKEYKIKSDNKEYLALLYLKEKIQITLLETKIISTSYFYIDLNLETIYKYNKIFKQFDSLNDVFDCIQKLFEKELIKIYNNNDDISLGFIMNSASCDNEEVIFKLKEKKMDKDEINERIRIEANNLRKKITVLEKENKIIKDMLNDYDLRLSYLEIKDLGFDSNIIKKALDLKFFEIELEEKYKKNSISIHLEHRASRDGNLFDSLNSIITKYNYQNLLVLFQTKKGFKFGIFINKKSTNNRNDIPYNNQYYYNQNSKSNILVPKSFLFSFSNEQIYYLDDHEKIICFNQVCFNEDNKCSINFCNNDLLNNDKNVVNFVHFKNIPFGQKNESNRYFRIQEIEIFRVSYSN